MKDGKEVVARNSQVVCQTSCQFHLVRHGIIASLLRNMLQMDDMKKTCATGLVFSQSFGVHSGCSLVVASPCMIQRN